MSEDKRYLMVQISRYWLCVVYFVLYPLSFILFIAKTHSEKIRKVKNGGFVQGGKIGTGGATRTPDTWFWRPVLYRLSYTRICGERGIRTPGTSRYNGFQDRRNRPLCHLSLFATAKVTLFFNRQKIPKKNNLPFYDKKCVKILIFRKLCWN